MGKKLNAFAYMIGVEPAIISRVENGKQDIKFQVLEKIAGGFGMKLSDLVREYEEFKKSRP